MWVEIFSKSPQSIWHPVYIYSHYTIHDHCIKFLHNTVLILFLQSTGFVLCDWIWSLAIEFISDIVKLNSTSVTTRVWLIDWRVGWSMSLLTVYICKLLPSITMLLNLVMDRVYPNTGFGIYRIEMGLNLKAISSFFAKVLTYLMTFQFWPHLSRSGNRVVMLNPVYWMYIIQIYPHEFHF